MNVFGINEKFCSALKIIKKREETSSPDAEDGRRKSMNIVIACAIFAAAIYMKVKYQPKGSNANQIFALCILAGVISLLTIRSSATVWQMLWPVADIIISGLILAVYRAEIERQLSRAAAHREAERRAEAERAALAVERAHMRSRASVAAICNEYEYEYSESMAA